MEVVFVSFVLICETCLIKEDNMMSCILVYMAHDVPIQKILRHVLIRI
jgi:hypothetical protein